MLWKWGDQRKKAGAQLGWKRNRDQKKAGGGNAPDNQHCWDWGA